MQSYVYFISDGHGHIKIGKADDVFVRLRELQTGNPYKLKVILSVVLKSMKDAYDLELELHKMFSEDRLEGEWFNEEPVLELINRENVILDRFQFGGLGFGKDLEEKVDET